MRLMLAAILAITALLPQLTVSVSAASGDRTLHLHYTHTGASGSFTFRRNGKYDPKVLRQLNIFLADWRTKEPTEMDPALFDLLWSVYQEVGARQPIHIVSSYRSPKTNAMLRKASSGVAENSQHVRGKAIDFFIPGVALTRLREVAMRHQVGGVGYYPTSGSPFVHLDTGNVRAWPRMTRAQLKKLFPDGRTLHLPTDGTPLSNEGRRYAELEWKKCRAVPCNGRAPAAATVMLASADQQTPAPAPRPRTLVDAFFGGGKQPETEVRLASLGEPTQRSVPTVPVPAPAPTFRSEFAVAERDALIPVPAQRPARLELAMRDEPPAASAETALSALAALEGPLPRPRVLMTNAPELVTAYAPAGTKGTGPQFELREIIERNSQAPLPSIAGTPDPRLLLDRDTIRTASLGGSSNIETDDIFDRSLNALRAAAPPASMVVALTELVQRRQPISSITPRPVELVAPELDHVTHTMVHPELMSSRHFAVMTEAEGHLDKSTELGPLSGRIGFRSPEALPLVHDRFVIAQPALLASR